MLETLHEIKIQNLTTPESEREFLPFDPVRDIPGFPKLSENDWDSIKNHIKDVKDRFTPIRDSYENGKILGQYLSSIATLYPNRLSEFGINHNYISSLIIAAQRDEFEKDLRIVQVSEIELALEHATNHISVTKEDIAPHFANARKNLFLKLLQYRMKHPSTNEEFQKEFDAAQRRAYKNHYMWATDYASFMNLTNQENLKGYMRAVVPELSATELSADNYITECHREIKRAVENKWLINLFHYSKDLALLTADDIKFTNEGMQLYFKNKNLISSDLSLPQSRKF